MSDPKTLSACLAVILPLGGLMGYMKKKSVPSLIAGGALGALYAASFSFLNRSSNPASEAQYVGLVTGLSASAALFLAMLVRFLKTSKLMPGGLALIGAWALFVYVSALR